MVPQLPQLVVPQLCGSHLSKLHFCSSTASERDCPSDGAVVPQLCGSHTVPPVMGARGQRRNFSSQKPGFCQMEVPQTQFSGASDFYLLTHPLHTHSSRGLKYVAFQQMAERGFPPPSPHPGSVHIRLSPQPEAGRGTAERCCAVMIRKSLPHPSANSEGTQRIPNSLCLPSGVGG